MRNLSDDEKKKLYKKLQDDINDAIAQGQLSWSNYISNNPPAYTSTPPLPPLPTPRYPPPSGSYSSMYNNISPTDKDARGHYPYQEPEVDEQGTLYGYKVLNACQCGCGQVESPRYPAKWDENGELTANQEPSEQTMYGIHCTKRANHPELENYLSRNFYNSVYSSFPDGNIQSILVKCALSGTVVETDQGFRAQHAMIVEVLYNGYWIAYQDYKKRSQTHQDYNPETEWRYITNYPKSSGKGIWYTFDDSDPKP